jgi:4-methylaminobutanoate oxidase (formaldehyde-forming)
VLLADPSPLLHHGEVVYRDGREVGYVRAASYGHTLGGAVGLAMVEASDPITADWVTTGEWSLDVAGARHLARASLKPMYDPENARIRF